MEHRDVVIVGAGPAGSSCAWALRRAGLDVLVVDRQRFPREKSCAGWITPEVLEALELSPREYGSSRLIVPISAFRLGVIGGRAVDVPFDRAVSYGIRRVEFDHYLVMRSGATFRPDTHIASMMRENKLWIIDGRLTTPLIVGAGGTSCPVARLLNAHSKPGSSVLTQETEIEIDPSRDSRVKSGIPEFYFAPDFTGYGWVFRKGRYVTVGYGERDSRHLHDRLREFIEFLREQGRAPDLRSAAWHGHSYLLHGLGTRRTVVEGALLVGDAAGLACPTSGEGIRPAVESGILAAETIVEAAGDYSFERLERYRISIEGQLAWAKPTRGLRALLPRSVEHGLGRRLVPVRWFARRVVLEKWFLHW
jgi:geranylgeranyl reductase family protein